ncbi:(Fe-S)-binding protein [Geoglobus ahangari]|uniref:(Fe-S)-binding protein n=1 Tax=Geoglobus ahangari TaxID=113653 RepID=UPI000A021428|nr:(Fe-S)-binding protein [Geoglobus ahangari]
MSGSNRNYEPREVWSLNCAKCGRCVVSCPTYLVTKWEHLSPRGRLLLAGYVENDEELVKSVFSCLTCGICEVVCPSSVRVTEIIEDVRRKFVEHSLLPERHALLLERMESSGNPYGVEIESYEAAEGVDVIYYPGCTSIAKEREIFESTVRLLDAMGVSYSIEFRYCCGSTALRIGGDDRYARKNFERLREVVKRTGASKIIVSCPGCYRTIGRDYRKFGDLGAEVQHMVQFLAEHIDRLRLKREDIRIAYHDSCHLGRHMGIFEEPRKVLRMAGELMEPENHGTSSFCCGGGGGAKLSYREITREVRDERLRQLRETGADVVVTSCPYCYRNLKNGDERLNIKDITIFLAERLER